MLNRKVIVVGVLAGALALVGCAPVTSETGVKSHTVTATPTVTEPAKGDRYAIVAQESVASYSVREKFLKENLDATAVGKTSSIQGELVLDGGAIQPSTVRVDLTTLKSDKSMRDNKLKSIGLETEKYPTAEFTITGAEGQAPVLTEGKEVAFKLAGSMKLHGTEKPLVFDAKALLQGDTVKVSATTQFKMELFNIQPPNILNLISVDDNVKLDIQVVGKKG